VFLKNVLIYFDKESKQPAIVNLRRLLKPGGLLVTGPAEAVSDYLTGMQRLKTWLFREESQS
jgi:chemotaxis methyl-accepting protein methylase